MPACQFCVVMIPVRFPRPVHSYKSPMNLPEVGFEQHAPAPQASPATNSASANAGVVIPTNAPVFVRHNGQIFSSRVTNVKAGDLVEVWHDKTVGYGAAQAPPGAPVYAATQIVIDQ